MNILVSLSGSMKRILIAGFIVAIVALVGAMLLNINSSTKHAANELKVYHIGILSAIDVFAPAAVGFRAKMVELGYVEGKNVIYEEVHHDNDRAANETTLKDFVAKKVDLIFVFPTVAALQAKQVTANTNIPVVFDYSSIEDNGLVQSLAHPGGNLTGVRYASGELAAKRLEILHELAPKLKYVWVVYDPTYPTAKSAISALRVSATSTSITLIESHIANMDDLKQVLVEKEKLKDIGIDALFIMPDLVTQSPEGWKLLTAFAKKHTLPVAGNAAFQADSGAVFSYIPNTTDTGKLSATVADKILRGASPSTLPILTPEPILRFNYKLAQSLGITASEGFMSRANEIVK